MKSGGLFLFVSLAVAAVAVASAGPASRKLTQAFAVTSNLDPLDTWDVVNIGGRTFVRIVDSPFVDDDEEEGTVLGKIFEGVSKALIGGIKGGGEIIEKAIEKGKEKTEEDEEEPGSGDSTNSAHGGGSSGTGHGGASHGGEKRRM